jgi:hypothetical protein
MRQSLVSAIVAYFPLDEPGTSTRFSAWGAIPDLSTSVAGLSVGQCSLGRATTLANTSYAGGTDDAKTRVGNKDFAWSIWFTMGDNSKTGHLWGAWTPTPSWLIYYNNAAGNYWGAYVYSSATAKTAWNAVQPANGTVQWLYSWHDSVNDLVGIRVGTAGALSAAVTTATAGIFPQDVNTPIAIGHTSATSSPVGTAWGAAMWNRLLTEDELQWLYNAGMGRKLPRDFGPRNRARGHKDEIII